MLTFVPEQSHLFPQSDLHRQREAVDRCIRPLSEERIILAILEKGVWKMHKYVTGDIQDF